MSFILAPISLVADVSAATNSMQSFVHPVVITLSILAGLVAVGFLINGGIQMMASSGKPDKLEHAREDSNFHVPKDTST